MLWEVLYEYVLPPILTVIGLALSVAIPVATRALFKWLDAKGISVEESRQRMFQTGIENAAQAVLRKLQEDQHASRDTLERVAVDYMEGAVPDQIDYFGVPRREIAEKVLNRVSDKMINKLPGVILDQVVDNVLPGPLRAVGRAVLRR